MRQRKDELEDLEGHQVELKQTMASPAYALEEESSWHSTQEELVEVAADYGPLVPSSETLQQTARLDDVQDVTESVEDHQYQWVKPSSAPCTTLEVAEKSPGSPLPRPPRRNRNDATPQFETAGICTNDVAGIAIDIETTIGVNFAELRDSNTNGHHRPDNPVWAKYCVASVAVCRFHRNGKTEEPVTFFVTPWPEDPAVDNPYSGEIRPLKGRRDFGESAFSVFSRLQKMIMAAPFVVAHNAPFDMSVLVAHMARVGMDPAGVTAQTWLCTSMAARQTFGHWVSLGLAAQEMGISVQTCRRHSAGYDAELCAELCCRFQSEDIDVQSTRVQLEGIPAPRSGLPQCLCCGCPCPPGTSCCSPACHLPDDFFLGTYGDGGESP